MLKPNKTETRFAGLLQVFTTAIVSAMSTSTELAIMGLEHFAADSKGNSGDLSYCQRFLDAMPKNYTRVAAYITWLKAHAPVTVEGNVKDGYRLKKDKSDNAVALNIKAAKEKPYWEFSPAKEGVNFGVEDVMKALMRVVKTHRDSNHKPTSELAIIAVNKAEVAVRHLQAEMAKELTDKVGTIIDNDAKDDDEIRVAEA